MPRWTQRETAQLYGLAGTRTIAEIASLLEKTPGAVAMRLHRLGIGNVQGLGVSLNEIARRAGRRSVAAVARAAHLLGIPTMTYGEGRGRRTYVDVEDAGRVEALLRRRRGSLPWTSEEHELLVTLRRRGVPLKLIAARLHRTPNAVKIHASLHGISR